MFPVFCAAALTALMATHCAMSIERDFDHEVAGLIQMFLVVIVIAGVIALARRRTADLHLGLIPVWSDFRAHVFLSNPTNCSPGPEDAREKCAQDEERGIGIWCWRRIFFRAAG